MNTFIRIKILSIIEKLFVKQEVNLRRKGGTEISFIVPVYNQEEVIGEVIRSVASCSSMNVEILILNDCSRDSTKEKATSALKEIFVKYPNIKRASLSSSKLQLFEVLCDSLLIHQSESPIVVDVQADITILEPNFDARIWRTFEENSDLGLLSGRGIDKISSVKSYLSSVGSEISLGGNVLLHCFFLIFSLIGRRELGKKIRHKFEENRKSNSNSSYRKNEIIENDDFIPYPKLSLFKLTGKAGRLGVFIDRDHDDLEIREDLYIGEGFQSVVMRGPLAFRKLAIDEVGGLDFLSFFQGFDDSDLAIRLHQSGKWKIAYLPTLISAPLHRGSMRKKKTRVDLIFLTLHILRIQLFRKRSALLRFLQP